MKLKQLISDNMPSLKKRVKINKYNKYFEKGLKPSVAKIDKDILGPDNEWNWM